jgi:death-on-curing protein
MKFLQIKDILLLHNMVIDATGGSHGLSDLGLLESAVGRMSASYDGEDLYPTIFLKAAALLHSLLMNHPFVDGNKRTAMYSSMTFLELNGYTMIAEQESVVKFALQVENDKLEVDEIASWLEKHTKKTSA